MAQDIQENNGNINEFKLSKMKDPPTPSHYESSILDLSMTHSNIT
jgi:hypothetical protein